MELRILCPGLLLGAVLWLSSIQTAYAQAYHFSNGWFPGRKRSEPPAAPRAHHLPVMPHAASFAFASPSAPFSSSSSGEEGGYDLPGAMDRILLQQLLREEPEEEDVTVASCTIRPRVQRIISDLIQIEAGRLFTTCGQHVAPPPESRPETKEDDPILSENHVRVQDLTTWIQRLQRLQAEQGAASDDSRPALTGK